MDIFSEYIVAKKKQGSDYAIIFAIIATAVVVTLASWFAVPYIGGVFILFVALAWWGAYKLIKRQNVEYEYILTNNELDIDKIMGKGARKRLCTINFKRIERCASISDDAFENSDGRTTDNYAGDMSNDRVYFVDYTKEAEQMRVIFEPNKKILQGLKKANPRLVTVRSEDIDTQA